MLLLNHVMNNWTFFSWFFYRVCNVCCDTHTWFAPHFLNELWWWLSRINDKKCHQIFHYNLFHFFCDTIADFIGVDVIWHGTRTVYFSFAWSIHFMETLSLKDMYILLFSEEECGHIVLHSYLELTVHLVKSPFLKSFE